TTSAARLLAPAGGRVVAFTAVPRSGYDGPAPQGRFNDEGPTAALTARMHSNIEHVLVRSEGCSPLDNLERNFFFFERPALNLCNETWMNAINDAVRGRRLSIMLTGLMGNATL